MEEIFVFDSVEKLDNLVTLLMEAEEVDSIFEFIEKSRRIRGFHQALSTRRNDLLIQCDQIHQEIRELQDQSKDCQTKVKNINQGLNLLNLYLNSSSDQSISNVKNSKEKKKDSTKNKKERRRQLAKIHQRENQKDRNFLQAKTEKEANQERNRITQLLKRYQNLKYEQLRPVRILQDESQDPESPYESVKLLEKDVIRKRYNPHDLTHLKAFQRELVIYQYLDKCHLVPTLLHYNKNKCTLYFPYLGDYPGNHPKIKRQMTFLLKRLKKFWGVYQVKENRIVTDIDPSRQTLLDSEGRGYLFDFSSPAWVVDRDKKYPMTN